MPFERTSLRRLVDSVADGSEEVDWDVIEAALTGERERGLVRQLRILAGISDAHRSASSDDDQTEVLAPGSPDAAQLASVEVRKVIGRIEPDAAMGGAEAPGEEAPAAAIWGPLRLLERVGAGTFGEVYRAFDTQLHRDVAVKLLRVGSSPARLVERVLREGRVLAKVHHANVVIVHGAESREGRVGLWMEYIRGATLEQLLKTQGTFGAREAALIGQDLCRAVAAVHSAGLVHRDIKAQNVMREEGGRIVLMDFGAGQLREAVDRGPARLTGTPLYLAPEVLNGGEATVRSDIYSLGVLLYHLVTGDFPVRAASVEELRAAHAKRSVVRLHDARPDVPDAFVQVVERATDPDPALRYASAGEFQAALRENREPVDRRSWPKSLNLWLAACATLLVLGAGAWTWRSSWTGRDAAAAGPTTASPALLPVKSIAVLPLEAASSEAEWFTSGLTDELISTLSRFKSLTVISRLSTAQMKGSKKPAHEIGAVLGADALLVGTVQRDGDQVALRVQLIHAGTDTNLWGESYRFAVSNLVSLQGQLARSVADRIHLQLNGDGQAAPRAGAAVDPRAYDELLKGRYELTRLNKDATKRAREYFLRAVDLSPDLAGAHAGLASSYYTLGSYGVLPIPESVSLATRSAERALELDPTLAGALATLGYLRRIDRDWKGAEGYFERALESNASDADTHVSYALTLAAQGLLDPAMREARRAQELDPLSVTARLTVACIFHYAGQHESALREGLSAQKLDPDSPLAAYMIGRFRVSLGHYADAVTSLERALALGGRSPSRVSELARALALAGRVREARTLLDELLRTGGPEWNVHPEEIAYVEAALGQRDRAFERLLGSCAETPLNIQFAKVDPRLDPLRGDVRFTKLIRCLNLQP